MIYKQREMTGELRLLHALDRRLTLSPKDRKNYLHLLKGLKGERRFDKLLNNLKCDHIQIHDLLLEHNGTVFQIDTLLITKEKVFVYEVKNYQGEFFFIKKDSSKFPGKKS